MKKNFKNEKWIKAAALALAVALILPVFPAHAYQGQGGEGGWGGPHGQNQEGFDRLIDELQLTDAQREQIKAIRAKGTGSHKEAWDEIKSLHEQLRTAMQSENFNEAEVRALSDQIAALQAQKMNQRVDKMIEIRNVLTPEQFKILQEKHKGLMEKWGKKGHRNGSGGFWRRKGLDEPTA